MEKKIVLTVLVCLSVMMLAAQLISGQNISQSEDDFYDRYEPWPVCATLILDWDLYPWHTVRFVDCDIGFNITCDNTVLDLKGHRVMFAEEGELGQGQSGIEINGKNKVTIKNGTIIGFQYGIWVQHSSEVNIVFNNVQYDPNYPTKQGIGVSNSNDVSLDSNTISGPYGPSVNIEHNSFDVSVINNNITSRSGDVGIGLYYNCSDVSILDNTITDIGKEGIHLTDSNNITVSGNEISDCDLAGIWLTDSNNNTIDSNTLLSNKVGIHVESVTHSTIYHNNFIGNEKHVTNVGSTNSWDVGYGTKDDAGYGGNYWDGYEGIDEYSGADKNVPGSDGMGDTPYVIDANNRDNYPLMDPWGSMLTELKVPWEEYSMTCYIAVFSNSSIADLSFSRAEVEISFTTSNGTFCKVIVPKEVLDGSFNVSIDDVTTACILNWDKTHHFINFAIDNRTHEVKITGEIAIRGDVNGDGKVNIQDIFIVAKNFGKEL